MISYIYIYIYADDIEMYAVSDHRYQLILRENNILKFT